MSELGTDQPPARLGFEKTAGKAQCSDPGHASRMFSDCHDFGAYPQCLALITEQLKTRGDIAVARRPISSRSRSRSVFCVVDAGVTVRSFLQQERTCHIFDMREAQSQNEIS